MHNYLYAPAVGSYKEVMVLDQFGQTALLPGKGSPMLHAVNNFSSKLLHAAGGDATYLPGKFDSDNDQNKTLSIICDEHLKYYNKLWVQNHSHAYLPPPPPP